MRSFFLLSLLFLGACASKSDDRPILLIFSKTEGYRHQSIEHGADVISNIANNKGYQVIHTENASVFKQDSLKHFRAVIFLNTTGDVLNHIQQADFRRFIEAGGGFIGIHSAADTEFEWPWYGKLVGAYFDGHPNDPNVREAVVNKILNHPLADSIPEKWQRKDEWYNYRDINQDITVLQNLDESTYQGGSMGENHPITWYHEYKGGKTFYTGMGHTSETFDEPYYQKLLANAIDYVAAEAKINYQVTKSERVPDENRFSKEVLAFNLNEPTCFDFLPEEKIIFIERKGEVKLYDPKLDSVLVINKIDVFHEEEDGLIGLAVDPDFEETSWIYLYYSPAGDSAVNRLSRFEFWNNRLIMNSEQVILDVPVQREECCHTGGSIAFDNQGNLYLSTGDNTNPFNSDGFGPMDERKGRKAWDAQRSSANTYDLRGKVLRIKPQPDGSYTIPDGNLFQKGLKNTKPEIYVMGTRNPYRISVDSESGYLYWGDVGPDARQNDSLRGPRGYDEINQARKAGFYGWPLFVGKNYAYHDYDFASDTSGKAFDPNLPVNPSPNNTGLKTLPPAQPAFIWYPYAESPDFPLVGSGGRNAMAGPVYHQEKYTDNPGKYPSYFDDKLFIYDWMRNWIMVVTFSEDGDMQSMEPFVPNTSFNNIIDMDFSPSGELYLLEYGTGWFQHNIDSRLVRIKYNSGNRQPVIAMKEKELVGQLPFKVDLSAKGSYDPDGDKLNYTWLLGKEKIAEGPKLKYQFDDEGIYLLRLKADDAKGGVAYHDMMVRTGNASPQINISVNGNSTFFWTGREIGYQVSVTDKEDGSTKAGTISQSSVKVFHDFLERGYDMTAIAEGHQRPTTIALGQQLVAKNDCKSCHKVDGKSIGPSYKDVAERYKGRKRIISYLSNKIINGGGGAWGEVSMSAHPELTHVEAGQIAKYIMSLGAREELKTYPLEGEMIANKHKADANEGMYMITAIYKDRGNDYGRIQVTEQLTLRHPRVQAENYNEANEVSEFGLPDGKTILIYTKDDSWLKYEDIDITDVDQLSIKANMKKPEFSEVMIEIREGSYNGKLLGQAKINTSKEQTVTNLPVDPGHGKKDIYIVFKNKDSANVYNIGIDWIEFHFKINTRYNEEIQP